MARKTNDDLSTELLSACIMGGLIIVALAGWKISALTGISPDLAMVGMLIFAIVTAVGILCAIVKIRREISSRSGQPLQELSVAVSPVAVVPAAPRTMNLVQQLRSIDWFQFEQVVAHAYRKLGFQVERRGGAKPDGGIDLILTDAKGERTAVQCKHWKSWKVNLKTVREFYGAMKISGLEKGILVTMRGYTWDARKTAASQKIELVDETQLARLLHQTKAKSDPEVLELLNSTKKICPKCENEMVVRTAKKGPNSGGQFWGCSTYPRCFGRLNF